MRADRTGRIGPTVVQRVTFTEEELNKAFQK